MKLLAGVGGTMCSTQLSSPAFPQVMNQLSLGGYFGALECAEFFLQDRKLVCKLSFPIMSCIGEKWKE